MCFLLISTATYLDRMDDAKGVGLRKLMQLQFGPDREIKFIALTEHADKNVTIQST